jgi:hypothetical protein
VAARPHRRLKTRVFFASGLTKVRHAGLGWVSSDTLAILLPQAQYHGSNADPLLPWGLHVAQCGWLCRLLAGATVVIEIGFPLVLFSRRARAVLVPATFVLQTGIRVLMGPVFGQFMMCYLFWVPWDRVGALGVVTKHSLHLVQVGARWCSSSRRGSAPAGG